MASTSTERPPKGPGPSLPAPVPVETGAYSHQARQSSTGTKSSTLSGFSCGSLVSGGDTKNASTDVSESRHSLRRELVRRRDSLTVQEHNYLTELLIRGQEVEVQMATQRLLDADLFPQDAGWGDNDNIEIDSESQTRDYRPDDSCDSLPEADVQAPAPSTVLSAQSMGSTRRLVILDERRKSQLLPSIWKAHETGLSVSKEGSKRAMLRRHSSFSAMGLKGGKQWRPTDIFRTDGPNRRGPAPPPMMPLRSSLRLSSGTSSSGNDGTGVPKRPTLRRMMSEGSRKSVTFGDLPRPRRTSRLMSEGSSVIQGLHHQMMSPPLNRKLPPMRSSSIGSVPSIHLAHPVQSPSAASHQTMEASMSVNTAPSIHHAHPVASPSDASLKSIGTVPSIQHAHPVTSPTASVKSGTPSLRKAHPVRSESFRSTFSDGISELPSWDNTEIDVSFEEEKKNSEPAAWEAPVPTKVMLDGTAVINDASMLLPTQQLQNLLLNRPVLTREASVNNYQGQGIEVANLEDVAYKEPLAIARKYDAMVSFNDFDNDTVTVMTSNSFDETRSYDRISNIFRRRPIIRSLSDDTMSFPEIPSFHASSVSSIKEVRTIGETDDDSMAEENLDYYDSWKVIEDEYVNGYGGGGTLPFHILGTSADDRDASPHVLSPPLMESLQAFFPYTKMGENFWMKYSLVRDGSSMHTFLKHARGAKHTILAIETVDGEVFGSFTSEPWRKNWNFFGSPESFLWRMRHTRNEKTHSIIDQAQMESEIDVFPFTGENHNIQLCLHDKLAVGGGAGDASHDNTIYEDGNTIKEYEWGYGLTVRDDLLHGTSSPCLTFGSPSLSNVHSDGSVFEIVNIELWTTSPCLNLEAAEKLELGKLFLEGHRDS